MEVEVRDVLTEIGRNKLLLLHIRVLPSWHSDDEMVSPDRIGLSLVKIDRDGEEEESPREVDQVLVLLEDDEEPCDAALLRTTGLKAPPLLLRWRNGVVLGTAIGE